MSLDEEAAYYDERWTLAPSQMTAVERERADVALSEVRRCATSTGKGPLRILEVGCGRGLLSAELAQFGSVTAIDLSSKAIRCASQRWADLPISFIAGDVLATPLDAAYDFACAMEVIEHVVDQDAFVRHVASALKPGGVLLMSTPNKWVARYWARKPGSFLQPIENWLSRRELRRLVSRHLTVLSVQSFCFNTIYLGVFRLLNSPKLNRWIPLARAEHLLGLGMHLSVVANKPISKI